MKLKAGTNVLTPANIIIAVLSFITVMFLSKDRKKGKRKGKFKSFSETFSLFTYIKNFVGATLLKKRSEKKAPVHKEIEIEKAIIFDI